MPTANTVPVSWPIEGAEVEESVAMRHGGVSVGPETGDTVPHVFVADSHQNSFVPPDRLQSFTVRVLNELPAATSTSKYSLVEVKLGVVSGSEAYWETVSAPGPEEAVTVTPSLLAWQVPTLTEHDVWLSDPDGAVGAKGALGGGVAVVNLSTPP